MQDPSIDFKRHAEASRYALLRRLVPAMRHQMTGSFQPVSMRAAIIEKRLLAPVPDLSALVKTSSDVRTLASDAARSSLDLMGWIAPDPEAHVPLDKAIQDALRLIATELSFRGIRCVNQTEGVSTKVALHPMRGAFVAALLALADTAAAPANLLLTAGVDGEHMVVTIAVAAHEADGEATTPSEEFHLGLAAYRPIEWSDVEAIAREDGVAIKQLDTSVELRLPTSPN